MGCTQGKSPPHIRPPGKPSAPISKIYQPTIQSVLQSPFSQFLSENRNRFVKISASIGKGYTYGTGFIFYSNSEELLVLTCAHNVRSKYNGDGLIITSSKDFYGLKVTLEGQSINNVKPEVHPSDLDIAVLIVSYKYSLPALKDYHQYIEKYEKKQQPVVVFRYTNDRLEYSQCSSSLVVRYEEESSKKVLALYYDCNTSYGFSGSPVLTVIDGQVKIVGVHTNTNNQVGKSSGIALTNELIDWLEGQVGLSYARCKKSYRYSLLEDEIVEGKCTVLALERYSELPAQKISHALYKRATNKPIYEVVGFGCLDNAVLVNLLTFQSILYMNLYNCSVKANMFVEILNRLSNLISFNVRGNPINWGIVANLRYEVRQPIKLAKLFMGALFPTGGNEAKLLETLSFLSLLYKFEIGYSPKLSNRLHTAYCIKWLQDRIQDESKSYAKAKQDNQYCNELSFHLYKLHIKEQNYLLTQARIRNDATSSGRPDPLQSAINKAEYTRLRNLIDTMEESARAYSKSCHTSMHPSMHSSLHTCDPLCIT